MFTRILRPLAEKEKLMLRESLVLLKRKNAKFAKSVFKLTVILASIFGVLTILVSKVSWQIVAFFWLSLGLVISSWVIFEERRKFLKECKSLEEALNNEAEVFHIKAKGMVEFEELEDEGAGYVFQVDDDQLVFVTGQDVYASERFPSDDFELIYFYNKSHGLVRVMIENYGKRLEAVRRISAKEKNKLDMPEHLKVIKGKLVNLENILILSE